MASSTDHGSLVVSSNLTSTMKTLFKEKRISSCQESDKSLSLGPQRFCKKLKNVSCEYDRLNGWNSTLQAAWYIRHVRIICFCKLSLRYDYKYSVLQKIVGACSMFYRYEGYRSVTPPGAARVNRTIFHNHSVHWYYITLIKGRDYIKHDIKIRHGKQNPRRGRWL